MAVYKVPQDVEAEDKLIGPFSFRQFIYLIIAALGIFASWLLARIFVGLFVIPLPLVIAFLALALPLRKDQPMETYLIAMIKFFFKPHRRIWDPEGQLSFVNITAPRVAEGPQLKEYSSSEASQRLSYLAQVVDTQGWSTRGAMPNQNLSDIFIAEANQAVDVLDDTSGVAQAFDQRIASSADARLEQVRQQMQATLAGHPLAPTGTPPQPMTQQVYQPPMSQNASVMTPQQPTVQEEPAATQTPVYNPYPASMHQHVLSPSGVAPQPVQEPAPQTENQAGPAPVSPDIIRLANNNDLSISAIAHEAQRLQDTNNDEVVISLR